MEEKSATKALEEILKMHLSEVNAGLIGLQKEHPAEYLEGKKLARDVLESHDSLLYSIMVGTPDFTDEQVRRMRFACAQHLLGKIALASYL